MVNRTRDPNEADEFGFPDSFYETFVRELPAKPFLTHPLRLMLLRDFAGSPEMEPLPNATEYFSKRYGIENVKLTAALSAGLLFQLENALLHDQLRKKPIIAEDAGLTEDERKVTGAFADDHDAEDLKSMLAGIAMDRILHASRLKATLGDIGFGRLKTNATVREICNANDTLPPEHAAQADYLDETILRLYIEVAYEKTKNVNVQIFNDGMKVREKMRTRAWNVLRQEPS